METRKKFIAAAVQSSPVYLDRDATLEKVCDLVAEAAGNGAELIVFPETFVPGYPYWVWLDTPLKGGEWFRKLYDQSVEINGPHLNGLKRAAAKHGVTVVVGVNERNPRNLGAIYNSNVTISSKGEVIGVHRKLVPTWAEKLIWTAGDGSTLKVLDTELGPLGTLACGENTNTLARFALLAMGELIHTSNYPSFPFTRNFDMPRGIQTRAGAHALEGKVYNIVSCSTMSQEIIDAVADTPEKVEMMSGTPNACSAIFGPDGMPVGDLLIDKEGIVYGDIDLERCIEVKQLHDIIGHYNRFDVFDLRINRRRNLPIRTIDDPNETQPDLQSSANGADPDHTAPDYSSFRPG